MKEFQIEKVEHDNFDKEHECFVLISNDFYIKQINFHYYNIATSLKGFGAVGMWRVKPTDK